MSLLKRSLLSFPLIILGIAFAVFLMKVHVDPSLDRLPFAGLLLLGTILGGSLIGSFGFLLKIVHIHILIVGYLCGIEILLLFSVRLNWFNEIFLQNMFSSIIILIPLYMVGVLITNQFKSN